MGEAGTIPMDSGRELRLQELTQKLTYEGLLEGLPTSRGNAYYLDRVIEKCQENQVQTPFYVVVPHERPIDHPSDRPYPFGPPAALPRITCTGRFRSGPTGEGDPSLYSELTIIWLQDEFAMPIEPSIVEQIAKLGWDGLASNFEY